LALQVIPIQGAVVGDSIQSGDESVVQSAATTTVSSATAATQTDAADR